MDRRREGEDRRGLGAERQGSISMDRRMMGTEDSGGALRIITDEERERSVKTEPADNSQRRHSPTHLHFFFLSSSALVF